MKGTVVTPDKENGRTVGVRLFGIRPESVLGVLGLAAIVATGAWLRGGAGFPGWVALAPAGGTLAVLHAGARAPLGGVGRVLGAAPLKFLGVRSYSWYLWHWPFVVFA